MELQGEIDCIAIQEKNHKMKCSAAQVQKFQEYLELTLASKFKSGRFISVNGFSKPAIAHVESELPNNIYLESYSRVC
ncbi:Restriction endonuclease [Nitrosomonas communis]|uniref:Restriction endonuclease n=2 Tax=Nitrosomonas communis TaxID=44574 RepID=A0A1I4VZV9_9PROT|nr:Restriction endonuclease [Nitrosomonas communis]